MAYKAKDGTTFGNREMGRHYDRTRGNSADKGEKKPTGEAEEGHEGGSGKSSESEAGDREAFGQVMAEHGPAHTTEIKETDGGDHDVMSHHEDGHKHTSHGHDVQSAHRHSMMAHTGEMDAHEEPDGDEAGMGAGGGEEAEAAPAIPTMG